MDKLVEMEAGDCIEDMDMFRKALVLYIRSQGSPGIRVLPFCTGDSTAWLILSRLVLLEP
jgi:protease II